MKMGKLNRKQYTSAQLHRWASFSIEYEIDLKNEMQQLILIFYEQKYIVDEKTKEIVTHCVYIRQHYRSLKTQHFQKNVYETINSHGLHNPTPIIPSNSEDIVQRYEIRVQPELVFI